MAESNQTPVLEPRRLGKVYGSGPTQVQALQGVDLVVKPHEFLAVLGPSGAGKSTLLHLLGGVDVPTLGEVLLNGQDLSHLDDTQRSIARRRAIAFVFQKINLVPTLSALDNVALPLVIDGASRRHARSRAAEALAHLGIEHRATHYPSEMSGGEQQRTAIARAVAIEPAVILADEPTGALDSTNGQRVVALLRRCVEEGQAVVFATHDPEVARQADRVIHLQDGRLVETLAARQIPHDADEMPGEAGPA
jgi:putative ABC transport system ATP-binding protein